MKYQLNQTNYCAPDIYEINKRPPRSYFIPFPDRASADSVTLKEKRYASSKVRCLNGMWDFKFYAKPRQVPQILDTEKTRFDRLDVPSCWQFRDYDAPFYVNTRYQFPFDPPKVPELDRVKKVFSWMGADQGLRPRWTDPGEFYNFVGIYRKKIEISDPSKQYILSFLGVCSCMDLYLNGEFVGYSEGSHNTAEFDLSGQLTEGENELLVAVHRWCTGSYLECQDMFRNNGIFRDVLLYELEPVDILDIDFKTEKTEKGYNAAASVLLNGTETVTFTLEGPGVRVSRSARPDRFVNRNGRKEFTARVSFEDLDVKEWNAEEPSLYTLYTEIAGKTCVKTYVGFKTITVEGNLYKLNGHLLKFKGVNHHDTSPANGYTLTPDEIEKDVLLCKEYNVNTIRTSHYPPDPLLLELADQYGLYIVDEADLETHGATAMKLPPNECRISSDPFWIPRYEDRAKRLYQRDKLHPAIVMWSLGNESGAGVCTDAEADYLHAHSDIPVHYEGAIHDSRKAYDIASQMYPPAADVHLIGEGKSNTPQLMDRPYFMCEYAHAMGVGPGNIESYWKEIYSYDNLIGGCIWEMVDHAVLHPDGTYTYGGDHGEWEHDGNFCVDGLFYPDRTPSTGAKIMKFTYRPIRVSYLGDDRFELFNTTGFTGSSAYTLQFCFDGVEKMELTVSQDAAAEADEKAAEAAPMTKKIIRPVPGADAYKSVTVITRSKASGEEIAREYIPLSGKNYIPKEELKGIGEMLLPVSFDVKDNRPVLSLSKEEGAVRLTVGDPYTILFRAATDNDRVMDKPNQVEAFYDELEEPVSMSMKGNTFETVTRIKTGRKSFTCTDTYENTEEGILVTSVLHTEMGLGNIPRFGKTFVLPEDFTAVMYHGRTGESYIDMKDQFEVGEVSCSVSDMTEPNIRPQESGNRCDCSYASISGPSGKVTFKAVDAPFELSVKPYSDKELIQMTHREDEIPSGTYVTIQAFQMGIGTGSCGPATDKKYKFDAGKDYTLKFLICTE